MTGLATGILPALWLGILTSISPCPLASNLAAVSFVGRQAGGPRRALAAGLAYSAGRALAYVAVGALVVGSVLSVPGVSFFLQKRMNQVLGPVLVLIGAAILGWLPIRVPERLSAESLRSRVAGRGVAGAGALGFLFALSFCPTSAGLFFGGLIPLAVGTDSRIVLPALYGLGTGLPVVAFAVLIAFGVRGAGRAFDALAGFERVSRIVTGVVFLAAGAWLFATHVLGLGG